MKFLLATIMFIRGRWLACSPICLCTCLYAALLIYFFFILLFSWLSSVLTKQDSLMFTGFVRSFVRSFDGWQHLADDEKEKKERKAATVFTPLIGREVRRAATHTFRLSSTNYHLPWQLPSTARYFLMLLNVERISFTSSCTAP